LNLSGNLAGSMKDHESCKTHKSDQVDLKDAITPE